MSKLSERDACSKYIPRALLAAGWNLQTQIRAQQLMLNHSYSSFMSGRLSGGDDSNRPPAISMHYHEHPTCL